MESTNLLGRFSTTAATVEYWKKATALSVIPETMREVTTSFRCSLCQVEFMPDEGGTCAVCGKSSCGIDLLVTIDKSKMLVCRTDLPAGVKAKPMLSWWKRGSLQARRAIIRRSV